VAQEETSIFKQRLGKHVPAATDTQATIEEFLETRFSIPSVQIVYKEEFSQIPEIQVSS
jgi:hypothetical protein